MGSHYMPALVVVVHDEHGEALERFLECEGSRGCIVRDAAPEAVGAAWALGMTPGQVLRYVRLPLAAPVIMAGIRTAAVINVGTATLAAFIGAGGLGDPIAAGLALSDTRMILSGALPAALLALLVDAVLGASERVVTPGR